jgi:hypothetical protein
MSSIVVTAVAHKHGRAFVKAKHIHLVVPVVRAKVKKNEVLLRKKIKATFARIAKHLAAYTREHYGDAHKVDKPTLPASATNDIINQISQSEWDALAEESQRYLIAVAVSGAEISADMIAELGHTVDDQLAIQNAELWAEHRSAEMVGRKWVAGELIDNPNARWAIDEATRSILSTLIDNAIADGSTVSELANAITDSVAFSDDRATVIARTEVRYADSQGALASYAQCEAIVGKSWSPDAEACVICQDNADASPIKLDEDFPSGDDAPPAHPNCECVIVPAFADEM